MKTDNAITVTRVSKSYGRFRAIHDLTIHFPHAGTFLLVGQNGSGKSTLLKLIAGLLTPDSGSITICNTVCARPMGYTAHEPGLYSSLTVAENLSLFASLVNDRTSMEEHLSRWKLSGVSQRKIWELSRGQQAKAGLARALLGDPHCIILDEPTANLDDTSAEMLCNYLLGLRNRIILIATHDIGRLSMLGAHTITLHNGEIQ